MTIPAHQQPPRIVLQAYGETNPGRQRQVNEDSYLDLDVLRRRGASLPAEAMIQQRGRLWIVADGMGGHVGGKEASVTVVTQIMQHYYTSHTEDIVQNLQQAIQQANLVVYSHAQQNPNLEGMGSTLVTAVLKSGMLYVAWVGDSRAYILRQGQLGRLTRDHSWVQQAFDQGTLTEEEVTNHPNRNVILRSVGAKPDVEPELRQQPVLPHDIFLLCSDGLCGVVPDVEIQKILQQAANEKDAVTRLIHRANELGGPDNITAAVISLGAYQNRSAAALSPAKKPIPPTLIYTGVALLTLVFILVFVLVGISPLGGGGRPLTDNPTPTETPAPTEPGTAEDETPPPAGEADTQEEEPTPTPTAAIVAVEPSPTPPPLEGDNSSIGQGPQLTETPPEQNPDDALPPPQPLVPTRDASIVAGGTTSFKWTWNGDSLPADTGFEILIWRDSDVSPPGAYDATALNSGISRTGNEYSFAFDVGGAESVKQNGGGTYIWTVIVVRLDPDYKRLTEVRHPIPIQIAIPGTGGDGGGGGGGNDQGGER